MTVVGSPLFPITNSSSVAPPLLGPRGSQDRLFPGRAAPRGGGDDDPVPVPTAPQQWPRIFPGL
jgi:hypothetical protein